MRLGTYNAAMADLFQTARQTDDDYTAAQIEVLEGLEPVRRRPGMYIGGTDERALHHLAAEILDNSMDEAVVGHATRIEVSLDAEGVLTIRDNGRGIPIDEHPKHKGKSALEVIFTTLHAGGKFGGSAYRHSGGLHGVGSSVVNALSEWLEVEVARDRRLYRQLYRQGQPAGPLEDVGAAPNRRGTSVRFVPDPEIFGQPAHFRPALLYRMARSKAYLFGGVEIRWSCDPAWLSSGGPPESETLHFPGGLEEYLTYVLKDRPTQVPNPFAGLVETEEPDSARVEWAVNWTLDGDGFLNSYCNTVPTPDGGTHESGLRTALLRGLKAYGERVGNRKAGQLTADDVLGSASAMLSVFITEPQFQGQTKSRLMSQSAAKLVETAVKDRFEHWLGNDPQTAGQLLDWAIERAELRVRRKAEKETLRKTATRRLRLPGKLADCSQDSSDGTEVFLVEGDSAGGSAKQARNRRTQAVLPLRGKILNVASASADKLKQNQELTDLVQALGCGRGREFNLDALRYERVIIMTDADVDGAHIASLLMTFFYREMPGLIASGRLFLAMPPLYRLSRGGTVVYARDDADRLRLEKDLPGRGKIEVSRFKGLGEMPPAQLKQTTMDPARRVLLQVAMPTMDDPEGQRDTATLVENLMGRKPEGRLAYIRENARFVRELDI